MKKLLSFLLVLVLSLGLLAGCSGDDTDSPSDTASSGDAVADDGIFSTETVKYADANGDAVYRIIRPEEDEYAGSMSSYIFKQMKETVGLSLKNSDDTSDGADAYEILIGDTNRPESAQAREYIIASFGGHRLDYIVCTIGKKIVIYGMSDDALKIACEYFVANYVKAEGVEGGIRYTCATEGNYGAVTINGTSLANFKIIRQHYNLSYITQMQIDELIGLAKDTFAYELKYYEDAYVTEGDYEIIVGNANRSGVQTMTNRDEFSITVSGNKVYLNGGSIQSTAMAVSEFAKILKKGTVTDADSTTGSYSTSVASYDKATYYTQKWGDDFDGDSIDATKWYHVPEGSYSSAGLNGRYSVRSSDPNYVFVSDGKFVISAGYDDTRYIGGMLMTDRTMLYKYGYLEMSAILPDGTGLWTSLWLDSRWHGYETDEGAGYIYDFEIDINECFGNATAVQANCHKWPTTFGEQEGYEHTSLDTADYSNLKRRTAKDGGSFANEFHTFGLLWNEEVMTFTCDGEAYFTYNINTTPEDLDGFHTLSYIRLSAAIGFANNPQGTVIADDDPAWQNTNKFIVDYVHIFQLDDDKQQLVIRS